MRAFGNATFRVVIFTALVVASVYESSVLDKVWRAAPEKMALTTTLFGLLLVAFAVGLHFVRKVDKLHRAYIVVMMGTCGVLCLASSTFHMNVFPW